MADEGEFGNLDTVDDRNPALIILIRTLIYGNYGIFLIMGHAGFISSTVLVWGLRAAQPRGELEIFPFYKPKMPPTRLPLRVLGFRVEVECLGERERESERERERERERESERGFRAFCCKKARVLTTLLCNRFWVLGLERLRGLGLWLRVSF